MSQPLRQGSPAAKNIKMASIRSHHSIGLFLVAHVDLRRTSAMSKLFLVKLLNRTASGTELVAAFVSAPVW